MPAKTSNPSFLLTSVLSPVILASFIYPSPLITLPSTGIFAPVLTKRMSPTKTSYISTSANVKSSICLRAVSGAISVNDFIADLVLFKVFCSK